MNSAPIIFSDASPIRECCLLSNLNSFAYDFVIRQKISNLHLNFFIVEQIPTLTPDTYDKPCPRERNTTLGAVDQQARSEADVYSRRHAAASGSM